MTHAEEVWREAFMHGKPKVKIRLKEYCEILQGVAAALAAIAPVVPDDVEPERKAFLEDWLREGLEEER